MTAPLCDAEKVKKTSILIVEDNLINRMVINGLLKGIEAEIMFAENGELAVEQFRSSRFDLVLMDISMPVMDGITASKEIRQLEEDTGAEPTPIVAVTAHNDDEHRSLCKEAKMNGFVPKPVRAPELYKEVSNWLSINLQPILG